MISVVVPLFNEEHSLETLYREIAGALESQYDFEVIFVDDGSTDGACRSSIGSMPNRRTSSSSTFGGTSGRPPRCRLDSSKRAATSS